MARRKCSWWSSVDGNARTAQFELSLGRSISIVVIPLKLCYSLGGPVGFCHPKAQNQLWLLMTPPNGSHQMRYHPWSLFSRDTRFGLSNFELYIGLSISDLMLYTMTSDPVTSTWVYLSYAQNVVSSHRPFLYSSLSPNSAIPALEFR